MILRLSSQGATALLFVICLLAASTGIAEKPGPMNPGMTPDNAPPSQYTPVKLAFGNIAYTPAPLKAGDMLQLWIPVRNVGAAAASPGWKLFVRCSGFWAPSGPCPIGQGFNPLGAIAAGGVQNVTLISANPAEPGTYELEFQIQNSQGTDTADIYKMKLQVPNPLPQKVPIPKAVPKKVPIPKAGPTPPKRAR